MSSLVGQGLDDESETSNEHNEHDGDPVHPAVHLEAPKAHLDQEHHAGCHQGIPKKPQHVRKCGIGRAGDPAIDHAPRDRSGTPDGHGAPEGQPGSPGNRLEDGTGEDDHGRSDEDFVVDPILEEGGWSNDPTQLVERLKNREGEEDDPDRQEPRRPVREFSLGIHAKTGSQRHSGSGIQFMVGWISVHSLIGWAIQPGRLVLGQPKVPTDPSVVGAIGLHGSTALRSFRPRCPL